MKTAYYIGMATIGLSYGKKYEIIRVKTSFDDVPPYDEYVLKNDFEEEIEIDSIFFSDKNPSTKHKDFFGKELFIGDTIALLERSANSVYIRKGEVIGFSEKMVRIKYVSQGGKERICSHCPYNLIKG